ncbi:uncharacterized protein G2W53_004823 [Senna tora]|uniref:Uncharacterized protein n=1 Tax=Senna tora TaxID=362788 RepID=A0A834XDQ1_9FABA|nr:uncharacterized protein G2W53_004823 [Senna tora]
MGDFIATLQQGLSTATNSGSDDAGRTRRLQPPRAFSLGHKTLLKHGNSQHKTEKGIVFMGEWKNVPYCFMSEGERTRRLRSRLCHCHRVMPASSPPKWVAVDRPCCNVAMKSPIFVMTWHAKISLKI